MEIAWQGERLAQDFGIRGYIIPFGGNVKPSYYLLEPIRSGRYTSQMAMDIALMKSLGREFRSEDGDRYLDFSFSADEWENFYLNELKGDYGEHRDDLSYAENRQQSRSTWENSLSSYPLLARIDNYYGETFYFQQNEIRPLLSECNSLQGKISDAHANSFLDKMTAACDEALKSDMAIALFCD